MDVTRPTVSAPAAVCAALALSACFSPFTDAPRSCTTDDDCFAGERCALAVDFGQCVDEDAPRIDAARFEPAVTRGGSALVLLTVNEAVDDGRVVLSFDVEGVGQTRASTSTATAPAVQLDVSGLADGSVGVSVVDVDGTPGDSTVANAVLRIDRTAPALAIAAAPINGTRFSDQSGLVVSVDADEDLTAITARQGEVNGNCLREGLRQALVCSGAGARRRQRRRRRGRRRRRQRRQRQRRVLRRRRPAPRGGPRRGRHRRQRRPRHRGPVRRRHHERHAGLR